MTDLQLAILGTLWREPGLTVVEIHDRLRDKHGCAQPTLSTLLRRMEGRGWVRRRRRGRAYEYSAVLSRREGRDMIATELAERAAEAFTARHAALVSGLLGADELSREDIERARALLDDLESELD